ncbi:unnamed protein product [Protopolystoma xenopodis]|uniref:Uncharacterized protein n=1 Tax=Protopolystoma xenopodis TaxID=117903 RepID=A0A3S5BKN2_9PLAT|nr:unnamed protein product [Protopolystoma xenopodis]
MLSEDTHDTVETDHLEPVDSTNLLADPGTPPPLPSLAHRTSRVHPPPPNVPSGVGFSTSQQSKILSTVSS